jgi:gliding motility-associated-like protein
VLHWYALLGSYRASWFMRTIFLIQFVSVWCLIAEATLPGKKLDVKGQHPLSVEQGKSITLKLSDLIVEADPSLNYPSGFYLEIDDGNDYSISGQLVTPSPGFTGELKVKVRVTNGKEKSEKFNLRIDVKKATGSSNQKPVITGQIKVEVNNGQSFKIELAHLSVTDVDDNYPEGFVIKILSGDNYTFTGNSVTPAANFTGQLIVKIRVNDGQADSDTFNFMVIVKDTGLSNIVPVITAQVPVTTFKNESVQIRLTDLSVTDTDDQYPSGFSLHVDPGANYSVSGTTITPSNNFLGTLTAKIKVNDGQDNSNVFDFKISVVEKGTLQITGQSPLLMQEDSSLMLTLSDLKVNDPSDTYPTGFTLNISSGENFTIDNNRIIPTKDYFGNLFVKVSVTKNGSTSNTLEALVVVKPINDAPFFKTFTTSEALKLNTPVLICEGDEIDDVDNTELAYVEISLAEGSIGSGLFSFSNTESIRGVADENTGLLVAIGKASLDEYNRFFQSLRFEATDSSKKEIVVTFRASDGELLSAMYNKTLSPDGRNVLMFDIPSAFTPNSDGANDRWEITRAEDSADVNFSLRVYNKNGVVVFESDSIETLWDGKYGGEVLPVDSYFYTIETRDSKGIQSFYKGIVTILR